MVIITVVVFILIFIFFIYIAYLASKPLWEKRRKKLATSMEILRESFGGEIDYQQTFMPLKSIYDGMEFECYYHLNDNSCAGYIVLTNEWTRYLLLSVKKCKCGELFLYNKKMEPTGIGKTIKLVDDLKIEDKRFDRDFHIETQNYQYAKKLLMNNNVLLAIKTIATNKVERFEFTKDGFNINMRLDDGLKEANIDVIKSVLNNLKIIYNNLPTISSDNPLESNEMTIMEKQYMLSKLIVWSIVTIAATFLIANFQKNTLERDSLELAKQIAICITIIGTFIVGKLSWRLTKNSSGAISSFIFSVGLSSLAIFLFSSSLITIIMELFN